MGLAARRWGKRDDMVVHEDEPFNAEPRAAAVVEHHLTPAETFYSRNHGPIPAIDPQRWRLRVDGQVGTSLTFSLDDLKARFDHVSLTATLQCAGNRRAGLIAVRDIPGEAPWGDTATSTARWTGVRLADVLRGAGVENEPWIDSQNAQRHVAFLAPDVSQLANPPQPYGGSIPLTKALSGEVLLAWAMNDAALTPAHGAPMRVVVPGWIGARSVKWVERITVQEHPSNNYFQAVAYRLLPPDSDPDAAGPGDGLSLGPVALNCAILDPGAGDTIPSGPISVRGYAFAGSGRRVARVDVSGDCGATWVQADLRDDAGRWAWRLWHANVDVLPGDTTLIARAWDDTGALQPAQASDLWNPKGYVNNSWPRNWVHVTDVGSDAGSGDALTAGQAITAIAEAAEQRTFISRPPLSNVPNVGVNAALPHRQTGAPARRNDSCDYQRAAR
jgi:sulfite oxidase